MSDKLPPNWDWIELGRYLENHDAARVPVSSKEREKRKGSYPYYEASGVIDQIDGYTHDGEYLLLGEDGANLLARSKPIAFLAKGKFWVNNHAHVLKCRGDAPNAYVSYFLNSIDLSPYVTGTAQPKLSQAKMNRIPIPVAPIDQQKNIVAEIEKQFSRLDEAVANLKRVKANLKRYKAAVLKAAVEGRLVETEAELARREGRSYETGAQLLQRILETRRSQWKGKGKYKEPAAPDTTDLPELPEGWVWVTAEQICEPIASGSTPAADDMFSGAGDVPFIKVYNLTFDGALDFSVKPTYVSRNTHEGLLKRSRVYPGDVLTNIVGPPLGKVSIAPSSHPEWNINQAIVLFRPTQALGNRLLSHWLMSLPVLERLGKTAKATAGQFNLQVSTCRNLALPLPPSEEQSRIVDEVDRRLSVIRGTEVQIEANIKRAERLRQSILSRAFCGGLTETSVAPARQRVTG